MAVTSRRLAPGGNAMEDAHPPRRAIAVDFPGAGVTDLDDAALTRLARAALAVRLYQLGRIGLGGAAAALGMTCVAFLDLLGSYNISSCDDEIDLEREPADVCATITSVVGGGE